jgi:putative transposase
MPQTYSSLWIHLIWATKQRQPDLLPEFRFKLYDKMRLVAKEQDIYLDFVNGTADHIHVLVSLKTAQAVSAVVQHLKGQSSHWVNEQRFLTYAFDWQDGYAAISVSPSNVNRVRNYIKNQEAHHAKLSFQDELVELRKKSHIILMP